MRELVETVPLEGSCESSLRTVLGTPGGVLGEPAAGSATALAQLRRGAFKGRVEPWIARPVEVVVAASPRASPGVCEACGWGPSRSLALLSREGPSSVRRGSRRAPSTACEESHQGLVRVPFERPLLGV